MMEFCLAGSSSFKEMSSCVGSSSGSSLISKRQSFLVIGTDSIGFILFSAICEASCWIMTSISSMETISVCSALVELNNGSKLDEASLIFLIDDQTFVGSSSASSGGLSFLLRSFIGIFLNVISLAISEIPSDSPEVALDSPSSGVLELKTSVRTLLLFL